jgi:hypothetical protein
MLERLINWRARVNGINWFEGSLREAPDMERGPALTRDQESTLLALEADLAGSDLPPSPLRSRAATVASWVLNGFALLAFAAMFHMLFEGRPLAAAGFLSTAALCTWLAYPGTYGR